MQTETLSPRTDPLLTLKLIWGAFVFSGICYGVLLSFLIKMQTSDALVITQFSQLMQQKEFTISVVVGFFLVTLSRLIPKFLFRSQLNKNPSGGKQEVTKNYLPGFILGMICLEALALLGFFVAYYYRFIPVYWVFGFVAVANMLIRFPSWAYIKFLAEESLGKPISF